MANSPRQFASVAWGQFCAGDGPTLTVELRGDDADTPEPYFRGLGNGTAKDRKRNVAA